MINVYDNIGIDVLSAPEAITGTVNTYSSSADTRNRIGRACIVLQSAAGSGTLPTLDAILQDSADNSAFADVSPAKAFDQITDGAASTQRLYFDVGIVRRYVRLKRTLGATGNSFTACAILLAAKRYSDQA